ncbi:MAG: DUF58 domain-containing protein [Spirochaetes bacterium]|nr:DUF58 domain-containing protein [Spirochaetota bacterium]MBU0955081.1 DUF58 domain-containing protein [Spirochaetota bacterium]
MTRISLRPDWTRCFLVGVLLFVLYLARAYLGPPFVKLYHGLVFLLLLDLAHAAWSVRSLYYFQVFSTTRPLRGQSIEYRIHLDLQTFIYGCRTILLLRENNNLLETSRQHTSGSLTEPTDFFPAPEQTLVKDSLIPFPNRGVFSVCLSRLELEDSLALLKISLPIAHEKILVLPRLVELPTCHLLKGSGQEASGFGQNGQERDTTRFRAILPYYPGADIRHIDWKRFGATGTAFLKDYEAGITPGIALYLDRRRHGDDSPARREAEDCSTEALLAVAWYFLNKNVPVHYRDEQELNLIDSRTYFDRMHEALARIRFTTAAARISVSPASELAADLNDGSTPASNVIAFFSGFDSSLIAFLEDYHNDRLHTSAVLCCDDLSEAQLTRLAEYRRQGTGTRLHLVRNSATIREDLS